MVENLWLKLKYIENWIKILYIICKIRFKIFILIRYGGWYKEL